MQAYATASCMARAFPIAIPLVPEFSNPNREMAIAAAACGPARVTSWVVSVGSSKSRRSESQVVCIRGLNGYGGLKGHNSVVSLGMPQCTEQCCAKFVNSLKASTEGKGSGGGALSSKCSRVSEIFQIAAIMNGLVLVGVAVGFVLLRIEASLEESE